MLLLNEHANHLAPLVATDARTLSLEAAREVERFLQHRDGHKETPLVSLPGLAREIGVGSIRLKDEGHRLGLGSFKAVGRILSPVFEEAGQPLPVIERVADVLGERRTTGDHRQLFLEPRL